MFNIFVIGDKSDILPSFINLTEILSTPVAFLILNLSMTLDTNVSPFIKSNYRPVSILPIPSKKFEKVLSVQLSDFFDNIFDHFLCAFRKGHGCQTTLLRLLEEFYQHLLLF
jgi:hypothetical protein